MEISEKFIKMQNWFNVKMKDTRGDLTTNTLGAIIFGVVIIGILIPAVNTFFPTFFSDTFASMSEKMNDNW